MIKRSKNKNTLSYSNRYSLDSNAVSRINDGLNASAGSTSDLRSSNFRSTDQSNFTRQHSWDSPVQFRRSQYRQELTIQFMKINCRQKSDFTKNSNINVLSVIFLELYHLKILIHMQIIGSYHFKILNRQIDCGIVISFK